MFNVDIFGTGSIEIFLLKMTIRMVNGEYQLHQVITFLLKPGLILEFFEDSYFFFELSI